MSTVERNKGTLELIAIGSNAITSYEKRVEADTEDQYLYLSNQLKLYKIIYEIESEQDCSHFSEIVGDVHGTRELDFHTLHYNGGGSLQEVLEAEITRMIEGKEED